MSTHADTEPRSLSAVMLADLVGYTTIVREDEARARRVRAAMRSILETTLRRRFDETRDALERAVRVWPDFAYNHLWLAATWVALGEGERARSCADRAEQLELRTEDANFLSALSWIRSATADPEGARRLRERVGSLENSGRAVDPCFLVLVDVAMEDHPAAIEHLRAAIRVRSPLLFHMPGHPMLEALRRHADYDRLLGEAGVGPRAAPSRSVPACRPQAPE